MNMRYPMMIVVALASVFGVAAAGGAEPMKVGPQIQVSPQPPDARSQWSPHVAFDPSTLRSDSGQAGSGQAGSGTYLVVWQQGRDLYETETSDIYAVRVSTDPSTLRSDSGQAGSGQVVKVLDAKPIAVCTAAESQFAPAVDYADGVFLVSWSDFRNGKDFDIYAARVSADGKVLDPDGFLVAGGAHNQYGPAVAQGDKGFLIAWQDFRDNK
ncbi:MAG: hypothetical protein C0404_10090, partial [Verrucomicrobia bacterium]|nr:hypothetical protein [Verrucomicrobiota bacterium]